MPQDTQTNTRQGLLPMKAAADLTGKEAHVATLTATGVNLTLNVTDRPHYVIVSGAASGGDVDVLPLSPDRQVRLKLSGTCALGNSLGLHTTDGEVIKVTTGQAWFVAEEAGVAGQHVLCRYNPHALGA